MLGRVIVGDCIEEMRKLPDQSFRGIVTSPPYNVDLGYKRAWELAVQNRKKINSTWNNSLLIREGYDTTNQDSSVCTMDEKQWRPWLRECIVEMARLLTGDGALFLNLKWRIKNKRLDNFADILDGFPVRQIIIWARPGAYFWEPTHYGRSYEVIYLIAKPDFRLVEKQNRKLDVWQIKPDMKNDHPAPFPLELARRCVQGIGEGPILDPFMGSGTTAEACELERAEWLGIDISKRYADMARHRLAKYDSMLPFEADEPEYRSLLPEVTG